MTTTTTLTDTPAAFFADHGWWTSDTVVEPGVVAAALDGARAVARGEAPSGVPPQIRHATPHARPGLVKVDNAWWADHRLAALATHPEIGRRAAELLGVDEVFLWHDQLLIKPPAVGGAANVGWHQDKFYWSVLAGRNIITAWVPLADITPDMGPLRFVDRSHHDGLHGDFEGFTPVEGHDGPSIGERTEGWAEHEVLLPAGGVSFHSPLTLHGSGPNTSGRDRPGLALHLIAGDVRIRRGRLHSAQVLTSAPDGELWRSPRAPRLWPPADAPLDPVGDLDPAVHARWVEAGAHTARLTDPAAVAMTGLLWSWYAGRDDERDLAGTVDHPLRTLTDSARLEPGKGLGFAAGALEVASLLPEEEWSGHRFSPAVVAETVLATAPPEPAGPVAALVDRARALLRPPSQR